MLSRFVFFAVASAIVVPPALGTFVLPNSDNRVSDWSLFLKPTNSELCVGRLELSSDGNAWTTIDGKERRARRAPSPHAFKTVTFTNEAQADDFARIICEGHPDERIRWNLSCLRGLKTWTVTRTDEIKECKDAIALSRGS